MPLTEIVPEVGFSRSAMTRRKVVLPQPDGPMKETNSPLPMVRSTSDSALHRTVIGLEGQAELARPKRRLASSSVIVWLSDRCAWRAVEMPLPLRSRCIPLSTAQLRPTRPRLEFVYARCRRNPPAVLSVPASTYDGKQGLTYFAGIAAETVGSSGICMHLLTMPPGARAKAHLHESHETAIYVLSGEVDTWYGDELEHHIVVKAGDLFYIPAGVPHLPANLQRQPVVGGHRPHRSQRAGKRRAAAASGRAGAGLRRHRRRASTRVTDKG